MTSDPDSVAFDNPALAPLRHLVGRWSIEVSNAEFLDAGSTLTGTMSVSWLAGEALLHLTTTFAGGPPASVQVIGRNEDRDDFQVLYADERGVSRIYAMTFTDRTWTQHREDPGFHQHFEGRLGDDGDRIDAAWSRSHDDGATWAHDFDLTYRRIADPRA